MRDQYKSHPAPSSSGHTQSCRASPPASLRAPPLVLVRCSPRSSVILRCPPRSSDAPPRILVRCSPRSSLILPGCSPRYASSPMPSGPPIRLSTDVCVLSTERSLQPGRFTNIYFISATHQLYVVTCSRVRVSSSTPRIQTTVKSKSITPTTTISCGAANTERATGGERWNWRNCCVLEAAQAGGLAGLAGAGAGRRGGHRDAATCGVLERPGKLLEDSGAQAADELPAFTAAWLPGRRYRRGPGASLDPR